MEEIKEISVSCKQKGEGRLKARAGNSSAFELGAENFLESFIIELSGQKNTRASIPESLND